jgi:hypothetical protein
MLQQDNGKIKGLSLNALNAPAQDSADSNCASTCSIFSRFGISALVLAMDTRVNTKSALS